jgi:hypothetical protein
LLQLDAPARFYRVVAGERQQLGTANIWVISGEWHTLPLEAAGHRFAVALMAPTIRNNGHHVRRGRRRRVVDKADSVTRLDLFVVTPLP